MMSHLYVIYSSSLVISTCVKHFTHFNVSLQSVIGFLISSWSSV